MRKNLPKIFIIFFLAIFILQIAALFLLLFNPAIARAATDINFSPQVTIGDFESGESTKVTSNTIGNYITAIYNYGIGIVGIVSAVVMMFGGFLWLVAGGDSGKVSEAKEWIKSALVGLILVLLSYTILLTINPDLVAFKPINITPIAQTSNVSSGLAGISEYGVAGFPAYAETLGYTKAIEIIGNGAELLAIVKQETSTYEPVLNSSDTVIPNTYRNKTNGVIYSFYNDTRYDGTSFVAVDRWVRK